MTTCGKCKYGHLHPQDMNARICHGAPPQVFFVPGKMGAPMQLTSRPQVGPNDPACAQFSPRVDITRLDAGLKPGEFKPLS